MDYSPKLQYVFIQKVPTDSFKTFSNDFLRKSCMECCQNSSIHFFRFFFNFFYTLGFPREISAIISLENLLYICSNFSIDFSRNLFVNSFEKLPQTLKVIAQKNQIVRIFNIFFSKKYISGIS